LLTVITAHLPGVRNKCVAEPDSKLFREPQIPARKRAPLGTLPVSSIHGTYNFLSKQTRKRCKQRGPGGVVVHHVRIRERGVQRRNQRVANGAEVLGSNRGQGDDPDAFVVGALIAAYPR